MAKPKKYKVTKQHKTRLSSLQVDARLRAAGIPANGQAIRQVSATEFHRAITAGKKSQDPANAWMVDVHTVKEYKNYRCYLTADGKAGIAIHTGRGKTPEERAHKGDVASLFSSGKGGRIMGKLIPFAVANGGRKLDCFAKTLHHQYARYGARAVGQTPFNDKYKPKGWKEDYGRYPVVAMTLPSSLDEVIKSYNKDAHTDLSHVHTFKGDDGYDRMIAYRDKVVENRKTEDRTKKSSSGYGNE